MSKIFSGVLAIALVAAIIYGTSAANDRDALNAELQSVKADFAITQVELNVAKQAVTSVTEQLNALIAELNDTRHELSSAQSELAAVYSKLQYYEGTFGAQVFSDVQPPILKAGSAQPVNLINSQSARNPYWEELKAFLLADPTDDNAYQEDSFNCTNFAEMLHNNAEASGFKAAFVAVRLEGEEIGHTLNAFKTVDKGLVYVDNTTNAQFIEEQGEWDRIVYIAKGKELGSISLGLNTPTTYSGYQAMKASWSSYIEQLEAYNKEVEEYNRAIFRLGHDYDISQWRYMQSWEFSLSLKRSELKQLRAKLEPIYLPLGIVSSFAIYW